MDISVILKTVISLIASIITLIGSISTPSPSPDVDDNVNSDNTIYHNSTITQAPFDEGDFKMGKYDLIVSPDGDDANKGTLESPLKTLKGAKEKLKALKGVTNETVTVWFRSGTYLLDEEVKFDSSDLTDVVYRSYPDEDVVFTGSVDCHITKGKQVSFLQFFIQIVVADNISRKAGWTCKAVAVRILCLQFLRSICFIKALHILCLYRVI